VCLDEFGWMRRMAGTVARASGSRTGENNPPDVWGDLFWWSGEPVKELDGYRWRKYGQKAIAASAFPRRYYRCSLNGCTAKKQVQRSLGAEAKLVTTYEGEHSHAPPQPHQLKAAAAAGGGSGGVSSPGGGSRGRPPPLRVGDSLDGTAESLNSSEGSARGGVVGFGLTDGRCALASPTRSWCLQFQVLRSRTSR
jgi:hypothetical protein